MDLTLYKAAMEGNTVDGGFVLANHLQRDEENGYQVSTAKGNTVLHVAALYGQSGFVEEVLNISPGLLCCQNKIKNETALHIAANEGHVEVVRVLIGKAGDDKEKLMRMKDGDGNTALHNGVRSGNVEIVKMLVKEDPEFEFPANKARETPLYLAAESGFHDILVEILESLKKPNVGASGPSDRTPLHAAVIQKHTNCARSVWQWNKSLCEVADKWGWNSLHYAVKQGLKEVVFDMLGWKKSLAYLQAGSDNDWTTTFHIASGAGHVSMINELSEHYPDCWEMLNSSGQNVFHVAVLNNQKKVVKSFLKSKKCRSLVDEPDNDGNTPVHLLAASKNYRTLPMELKWHPRAKRMSFNKENQTPLDVALSLTWIPFKDSLVEDLNCISQLGRRDFNPKYEMETRGKIQQRKDDLDQAKEYEKPHETLMRSAQIHLVLATLLMTVTFAAGYTLPGGFESDAGPNKGMAVLIRNAAFCAFVVTDAIAFICSAGAIFIYFTMAALMFEVELTEKRFKIVDKLYSVATLVQLVAIAAVEIAFITGMYATLAHSVGLAVTVCVLGCISFPMFLWCLRQPYKLI